MSGVVLPIERDDQELAPIFTAWSEGDYSGFAYPRSRWLHDIEQVLRRRFPSSSSRDRTLTARTFAPFQLAKPGVP